MTTRQGDVIVPRISRGLRHTFDVVLVSQFERIRDRVPVPQGDVEAAPARGLQGHSAVIQKRRFGDRGIARAVATLNVIGGATHWPAARSSAPAFSCTAS